MESLYDEFKNTFNVFDFSKILISASQSNVYAFRFSSRLRTFRVTFQKNERKNLEPKSFMVTRVILKDNPVNLDNKTIVQTCQNIWNLSISIQNSRSYQKVHSTV